MFEDTGKMPEDTWTQLLESHAEARGNATGELPIHQPKAAILACSDARVPPSVVFNQPAGTLFVVRIAGNTATPAALASLDYAVAALGVELIVVLGHTGCGAVQAAAAGTCGGHLAPIVEPICHLAKLYPEAGVDELVHRNVANAVEALHNHPGPVGDPSRSGLITIRGTVHDLRTGSLDEVITPTEHHQPDSMRVETI